MRNRWLLNLSLVFLIAGLAWFVVQQTGREKTANPSLTALAPAAVARIRIERPGQKTMALEKTSGQWRMTAPSTARANTLNVDSLLRLLSAPSAARFPVKAEELAPFGLDKPQARVWLENEEIVLGALHPLKSEVYVRYQDTVILIPAQYLAAVTYSYTHFIDTRLLEETRRLTALKLPSFTLTLQDGVWRQQPPNEKLTTDRLNDFVAEWQHARALSVDNSSGANTIGQIEIDSTRDGKSEKLVLGILADKPDFVLQRQDENLQYHFPEATGKRLLNLSLQ